MKAADCWDSLMDLIDYECVLKGKERKTKRGGNMLGSFVHHFLSVYRSEMLLVFH